MAELTPYSLNLGSENAPVNKGCDLLNILIGGDEVGVSNSQNISELITDESVTTVSEKTMSTHSITNALSGIHASDSISSAQGQAFEPLDKSASQTVKLNPKMELSRPDLLKLLSYMEGELQARDVVIATLKTERIKNLLHFRRVGLNDPFLALQRDSIGGRVIGGGTLTESEIRHIEETQLQQLENLIMQQRKAHQRMRQVLRETEKRHSWTVEELEKERKKHENDQPHVENIPEPIHEVEEPSVLKQELDSEKASKKKAELEVKRLEELLEEERSKQKQIIIMLLEVRKRLALQYVEERKRSEDLAQILSEEKGRIDSMAEGLEEESKKSLQMEAELEKQLAEFDLERQQMHSQMMKKEEKINEQETVVEKLQREVEHYKKQLQEAHNVAMFQQTLSVSPPRIGIGAGAQPQQTTQPRPQPPQLPAKPPSLTQASPALSNVTKAVQLTATVNSVPVSGPTTGIARGIQPNVAVRPAMYSAASTDLSRTVTTTTKPFSESDSSWAGTTSLDGESSTSHTLPRVTGVSDPGRGQPQVVQVSPRVNVSASPGSKVITTPHGGKVTFHVTTNAAPGSASVTGQANGQVIGTTGQSQTLGKKPLPPTRGVASSGSSSSLSLNKPLSAPPVPPNKPVLPLKKDIVNVRTAGTTSDPPISVEVKPQKVGPQTVKFGITISKGTSSTSPQSVTGASSVVGNVHSALTDAGGGVDATISSRRETAQVHDAGNSEVHACVRSLSPELENFHQLLSSMAGSSDVVDIPSPSTSKPCAPLHSFSNSANSNNSPDSPKEPEHINFRGSSSSTKYNQSTTVDSCSEPASLHSNIKEEISQNISCKPLRFFKGSCESNESESPSDFSQVGLPVTHTDVLNEENSLDTRPCLDSQPSHLKCNTDPISSAVGYPPKDRNISLSSPINSSDSPFSSLPLSPTRSFKGNSILSSEEIPERENPLLPKDHEEGSPSLLDVATPLTADGMTALHLAAQGNNWESIPVLVRCGSNINSEDDEGRTALYIALQNGCCTTALSLLSYPLNSFENTTKNGCNLFHAAIQSKDAKCVAILAEKMASLENGSSLLQLLVTSENHDSIMPLAMALSYSSMSMVEELVTAGLDLALSVARYPQLVDVASPSGKELLTSSVLQEKRTCCVWLELSSIGRDPQECKSWCIGGVSVTPETQWKSLEEKLLLLLFHHLGCIQSDGYSETSAGKLDGFLKEEQQNNPQQQLGLCLDSVRCFAIGSYYWKIGNASGMQLPYCLLLNGRKEEEEESTTLIDSSSRSSSDPLKTIRIYLQPLDSIAYSCFIPVPLLKSYLRMLCQSKCLVIYGAKCSGKKTLARYLASLLCSTLSLESYSSLNISDLKDESELQSSVQNAFTSGSVLVLGRVPREQWSLLLEYLRGSQCMPQNGFSKMGHIIATMDSWRRPSSGPQENEILWIQLRHDRQPLHSFLGRFLKREVLSRAAGTSLPVNSLYHQVSCWVSHSYARFCDIIMSLGFSSVLRGPHLLVQYLATTKNPRDVLLAIKQAWNDEIVPTICNEVQSVWQNSSINEGRVPDKSRVSTMALQVILQRAFLTEIPTSIDQKLLSGFQPVHLGSPGAKSTRKKGQSSNRPDVPPRPKDLCISPSTEPPIPHPTPLQDTQKNSKTESLATGTSPTSPEWNEEELVKILGLPPMGYS